MRTRSRWVSLGAALLAISLSGCGGPDLAPTTLKAVPKPDSGEVAGATVPLDLVGADCGRFPPGEQLGSLRAMADLPLVSAAENSILTDYAAAVRSAGLMDQLNYDETSATVFVPDNAAFDALRKSWGEQRYQRLMSDKNELATVLRSYVVNGRNNPKTLLGAGTVDSLAGGKLTVKGDGTRMTVTDATGTTANVVCGNIPTQTATVYVVDKIITPTGAP